MKERSEFLKNANILVPCVVDCSGAEIKRTVVSNKKDFTKVKKYCDFKYCNVNVTLCSSYLWSWNEK